MKITSFFASCAKAAFALAAVVMMSAAFTACSSSDDDDNPPVPTGTGTVTFDGTEKPIVKTEYEDEGNGDYRLYLYLSADGKEKVQMNLNKNLHITNTPIDLTQKEKKHTNDEFYWLLYYNKVGSSLWINTYADPEKDYPVFKTGTLTMSGSPERTINIKLENGLVKGKDGKEHTLTISYSGPMTETK